MLKEARIKASSSIGLMIALGHYLLSPEVQSQLDETILPVVIDHLPPVHFRVQKCYALLLMAAKLVSENLYSSMHLLL